MQRKILSLILIIQSIFSIYSKNLFGASEINIPSEYISDTSFISMMDKDPIAIETIYASPKGSGSSCSESSPCSLETAVENLEKGYTLYLKGGTYDVGEGISIDESGSEKLYIKISSAPNEEAIITSSKTKSVGLFEINGSYIIIENITFKNVEATNVQGIVIYNGGQNHVIIRRNTFDSLKTPKISEDYNANAILLMGENKSGIKQIIIYDNTVTNNVLGYSEAISVAGNCEEIYVLKNTLKRNTNIGIDFYGNAKYCKYEELDQPRKSVAMYNTVEESISPYADCGGLYVDGARDIYLAENTVKNSQYGIEIGSEERNDEYPVKNIIVKNNILSDNTVTGIRLGGFDEKDTGYVQNCDIIDNVISGSHTSVIISKAKDITFEGNQMIDIDKYFIDMEFTESYTKNIEIENNVFSGAGKFRLYGATKLSLDEFIDKYPSNSKK